jgi:Uma2 family endonuclease
VQDDAELARLPYKLETNEQGQVIVNPPSNIKHANYAGLIAAFLQQQGGGRVLIEPPIATARGVKVPDIAWMRTAKAKRYRGSAYPVAPELCVEVLSPRNTSAEMNEKITLYFEGGAQEVWLCLLDGRMRFHVAPGKTARGSRLFPNAPTRYSI